MDWKRGEQDDRTIEESQKSRNNLTEHITESAIEDEWKQECVDEKPWH